MKLTPGKILELAGQIGKILEIDGVFDTNGEAVTPVSPSAIAKATADILKLLESDGVVVPGNVDKVVQLIPLILQLAGVK